MSYAFIFFSLVKHSIKISLGSTNTPFIVLQIVSCYLKAKQKKLTEDVVQVSFQYRQKRDRMNSEGIKSFYLIY